MDLYFASLRFSLDLYIASLKVSPDLYFASLTVSPDLQLSVFDLATLPDAATLLILLLI